MDWLLTLATTVLVAITGWYAWLTRQLSERAAESVQAAERSARAAEESVLSQAMPVVLLYRGGSDDDPQMTLHNVSSATAIDIHARVFDAEGQEMVWVRSHLLEPGQKMERPLGATTLAGQVLEQRLGPRFESTYSNPYGRRFRTVREDGDLGGEPWPVTMTFIEDGSAAEGWRRLA